MISGNLRQKYYFNPYTMRVNSTDSALSIIAESLGEWAIYESYLLEESVSGSDMDCVKHWINAAIYKVNQYAEYLDLDTHIEGVITC